MSQHRQPLDADTMLSIQISVTISHHRYDHDPAAMLTELQALAGDRPDFLGYEAGRWAGYHETDLVVSAVVLDALRSLPDTAAGIAEGRRRRAIPPHSAPEPSTQRLR